MYTIGDRIDRIVRKHVSGYFAVLFRHTVDIVAEIERQVSHVEQALAAEHLWHGMKGGARAKHAFDELQWKLIVTCRDWGMGGKHTVLADALHVLVGEDSPAGVLGLLIQQFQGQQAGMPLIHME